MENDVTPAETEVNETQQTEQVPTPANSGVDGQESANEVKMPTPAFKQRIADAQKSGANSALTELFKAFGVTDMDGLTAKMSRLEELEEKTLTESEKAQRDADKRQREVEALKAEREAEKARADALEAQIKQDRMQSAVIAAASKAKDPRNVWMWVNFDANKAMLEKVLSEDGQVSDDAVKEIVEACAKDQPHFFGGFSPGVPSNKGATPPTRQEIESNKVLKRVSY